MTARGSRTARFVLAIAVIVLDLGGIRMRGAAQDDRPDSIPTRADDRYSISQSNGADEKAPSGYAGRTDTSMLTALGIVPATRGKSVIAHFTFSNKIRTCPDGDGVVEGEGEYSLTIDKNDNGSPTSHWTMHARAKYKGQVNDDAMLDGPVKAEIDYTTSDGNTQHVTIPFAVGVGFSVPSFGPFSGGDPSHGNVSDAYAVGMGLAFWAGIYYSEAQMNWRDGFCAVASFDPPSRTVQPPPNTQVKVKAHIKSKQGEIVKAHFIEVRAHYGASVNPTVGWSTDVEPLLFTYTAPNQKATTGSFEILATSRAGIAKLQVWEGIVGRDWSGQIECSHIINGDEGHSEQQTWSYSAADRYTVEVIDAVAHAQGYSEQSGFGQNLRPIARQGYVFDNSSSSNGVVSGSRVGRVTVDLNMETKRYRIDVEHRPFDIGVLHTETCDHSRGCESTDINFGVQTCFLSGSLTGEFTNPNELSGSNHYSHSGEGRSRKGTQTWDASWHLSRKGTAR